MEHQTEFNSGEAIQQYITLLNDSSILRQNELEELADHLHLESQSLVDSGLNQREAFEVAKIRFGEVNEIQEEFNKSKPYHFIGQFISIGISFYCAIRISVLMSYFGTFALFQGNSSGPDVILNFALRPIILICSLIFFYLLFKKLLKQNLHAVENQTMAFSVALVAFEIPCSFQNILFFAQDGLMTFSKSMFWLGADSQFMMFMISVVFFIVALVIRLKRRSIMTATLSTN